MAKKKKTHEAGGDKLQELKKYNNRKTKLKKKITKLNKVQKSKTK